MITRNILLFTCIILCAYSAFAQNDSALSKLSSLTDIDSKTLNGLEKQYSILQSKLSNQSSKLLTKMQRKENKLQSKLTAIDSTKAQELFTDDVKQHYTDLHNTLTSTTDKLKKFPLREYVPGLDSMQTSLSFLMNNPNLPTDKLQQLQSVATKLKDLQGELQKANDIQTFIREREASLKEQLMNTGLAKQLTGINKQVYYYQTQLAEYKSLLNDKEKLKEKLLETVRSLPAFQKFWQKNSYLAALFPMQGSPVSQSSIGLQTRANVQNILAQRFGGVGSAINNTTVSPQQLIQNSANEAQAQVTQLKNKLSRLTEGGNSDMTMPDFKPNDQKTKSFLKRLQYGFNIQSQTSQYYVPATSDLALTLGYKLSNTKEFGIGASYKMGWGNGLKDIHISSEGIGLRSYADIKFPTIAGGKMFGGLWFSGGFEYNYLSNFRSLQELHNNVDVWQRSALFGLSKKYKIGQKREGNIQVLYDFLHNQQTPPSQAFKFRLGYSL